VLDAKQQQQQQQRLLKRIALHGMLTMVEVKSKSRL